MKRNVLNSPRLLELKKRRQRAFLSKIFISGFGLLVIFSLLAYLSRLSSLNIDRIEVTGNKVLETEALQSAVREGLAGKYLWLFPKTNILYYPENSVRNVLKNKFKRINDITFSIKDRKILEVSITERTPKYTWCGTEMPQPSDLATVKSTNPKCYFMDENGYIFDEAPYFSGEVYFKFYGKTNTEDEIPSGSYFFQQNFKQLVFFKDVLPSMGLKPATLYINKDQDIEIFLSRSDISADEPKIILKTDTDFQNAAENLEAALNTDPLRSELKNKYSSLKYIDLRFGNKVYYRF